MENFFLDQPVKNDLRTHNNTQSIITCQGDACTADCLLDYSYFKDYCKTIMIDLSKQQALDADQKAIQQTIFTGNLEQDAIQQCFHYRRSKTNHFRFSEKNRARIVNLFYFNILLI